MAMMHAIIFCRDATQAQRGGARVPRERDARRKRAPAMYAAYEA